MHKYRAQPTIVDGIYFPSKKEARHHQDLLLAKRAGALLVSVRQVCFYLPGGVRYLCDFAELWRDGQIRFVDCKGLRLPMYKMKKKMVEALYPGLKIIEA